MGTEHTRPEGRPPGSRRRILVVADHDPDERLILVQLESVAPDTDFELEFLDLGSSESSHPEVASADRMLAIERALADFDADQILLVELSGQMFEETRARFDLAVTRTGGV